MATWFDIYVLNSRVTVPGTVDHKRCQLQRTTHEICQSAQFAKFTVQSRTKLMHFRSTHEFPPGAM